MFKFNNEYPDIPSAISGMLYLDIQFIENKR